MFAPTPLIAIILLGTLFARLVRRAMARRVARVRFNRGCF